MWSVASQTKMKNIKILQREREPFSKYMKELKRMLIVNASGKMATIRRRKKERTKKKTQNVSKRMKWWKI